MTLSVLLNGMAATPLSAADLPDWFENARVQAHNEHGIDVAAAAAPEVHQVIRETGARVLTRIVLNRDEGAWWPSAVGETHELTQGRDLVKTLIDDVHARDMRIIGYFRHMSDMYVQTEHPDWVCRDHEGKPVREPRAKRAKHPVYVICQNSPYREYIRTRLVELAQRGIDMIYFDSWHMSPVCTCRYCKEKYERDTGVPFPFAAVTAAHEADTGAARSEAIRDDFEAYPVGKPPLPSGAGLYSKDYLAVSDFVSRSLVQAFTEWRQAVTAVNAEIRFAIGSSLYPVFERQPHITDAFLEIADTSKTEFHKPFGGNPGVMNRVEGFAAPTFDVQTALGWTWTRDSSGGRPPLMWIPFIKREKEALYSSAAAYSYGCIASLHLRACDRRARKAVAAEELRQLFGSSFERGDRISPCLAGTRPYGWAALHISEAARNRRLGSPERLWTEVFSPVLGAFEALKEAHVPTVTVTDKRLLDGLAPETRLLLLPWPDELSVEQREALTELERHGVTVLRLETDSRWHLAARKPELKAALLDEIRAQAGQPPVRIQAPGRMHAAVFRHPQKGHVTITLVNSWGWYRSHREFDPAAPSFIDNAPEPDAISGVTIQFDAAFLQPRQAFEAVEGKELEMRRTDALTTVIVPAFQINRCVRFE